MKSRLLLSPAILQLLTRKDQSLLVRWDTLLVLNFRFHIIDRVRAFHLKGNCLSGKGPQHKMEGRLLLDVVTRKNPAILQLFTGKDQPLLILAFMLTMVSELSTSRVEGRLLLNVVISQSPAVFQLLSGKDQLLLVWGDSLLVLDLGFDIINGVSAFNFEGSLAGEGFDKDLHTTTETEVDSFWML